MKGKSTLLLFVFCGGLLATAPVQARVDVTRSLDDSLALLFVSEALLMEGLELEQVRRVPALMSLDLGVPLLHPDDAALAAAIHAQKKQRNELDTSYRLLSSRLRAEGKDCEADRVREKWQEERGEINAEIGRLHKLRGDRRRWGTKLWHSLKRRGRSLWRRIGPLGRSFLRRLGPEVLQVVVSGGAINAKVLKFLVKSTGRSMARERIKALVYRGVERLLQGQLDLARAAGVDLCDPDGEEAQEEAQKESATTAGAGFPDGASWRCRDVQGFLTGLKARESVSMKTLQSDLDFELLYSSASNSLEMNFGYDVAEEWGVTQEDGTIGEWHVLTMNAQVVEPAVPVDTYGVFQGTLEYDRHNTEYDMHWKNHVVNNYWGLIPPENHQTAYVCMLGANPLPESQDSLTPANFRKRCGTFYYYECSLDIP